MLAVDPRALNAAAEALMIAARSVTTVDGLKVVAETPRLHAPRQVGIPMDDTDERRIRAITLGAIVALCNGAAYPGDEVHLTGLTARESNRDRAAERFAECSRIGVLGIATREQIEDGVVTAAHLSKSGWAEDLYTGNWHAPQGGA
jgi:hypothetical protein